MTAFVQDNIGPIVVALTILLALALIGLWVISRRLTALRARLDALTRGEDGRSLQAVIEAHAGQAADARTEVTALADRTSALEAVGRKAFQRIGLVRFNPFEDTGGNQSFALALLDADGDGIVITGLHARGGTRIYAKAIAGGRPEASLSEEEGEAIRLARGAAASRVVLAGPAMSGAGDG